jgi:hypothetical protein
MSGNRMAIPQAQLETWSRQGAVQTASDTYAAIRTALSGGAVARSGHSHDVYLQGSYKNGTNIRGDSDVDVVVQLTDVHTSDVSRLRADAQERHRQAFVPAEYGWEEFRRDALADLRRNYTVQEGRKSLKVAGGGSRLPADVVVCVSHWSYNSYEPGAVDFRDGMAFWTRPDRTRIVNYPIQHYQNGVAKNQQHRTGGNFKALVRIFKNARGHLVDRNVIAPDIAPSYFVECWLSNAPDDLFIGRYDSAYPTLLNFLVQADYTNWRCGNGYQFLFGTAETQWSEENARTLCRHLIALWNSW